MSEKFSNIKILIGITGLKAGGKDEMARALSENGYIVRRVSDAIRAECAMRGINDPTVEQLMNVGNEGRQKSGNPGYWTTKLLEMMDSENASYTAINGIRNPGEVDDLINLLGERFVLVGITAPTWLRYERAMKRKQGGDPDELKSFLAMDDRDRGIGEPLDGQQVDRTLAMVKSDFLFNNDGTLEYYRDWIHKIINNLAVK